MEASLMQMTVLRSAYPCGMRFSDCVSQLGDVDDSQPQIHLLRRLGARLVRVGDLHWSLSGCANGVRFI